jgi:hypothetical protein
MGEGGLCYAFLVAIVEFDASRLARPQLVGDHARPLLGAR